MEMSCDPCGEDEWKGGGWGTSSTRLSEWGESNGTADFRQEVNKKRKKYLPDTKHDFFVRRLCRLADRYRKKFYEA